MINQIEAIRNRLALSPHDGHWQVGKEVGTFLRDLTEQLSATKVLEIGTSHGYSALWFIEALQKNAGHLWTVESKDHRFIKATENFVEAGVTNLVTQIFGHAPEAFTETNWPITDIDLVFMDATKKEYGRHFRALQPHLSSDAIILADNVQSHLHAMSDFFEAIEEQKKTHCGFFAAEFGTGMVAICPNHQADRYKLLLENISDYNWQALAT